MTDRFEYRPPADDAELQTLLEIQQQAFNINQERCDRYAQVVGREHFRVLAIDGQVGAGLAVLPKGQFFGGRPVSTWGIGAVAVEPSVRGCGAGHELMRRTLLDCREQGCALSTLYPATQTL